ncbi:MAG TPA: phosphate ABC transporter permease PstA [Thermoanaerobaculia bacterium]
MKRRAFNVGFTAVAALAAAASVALFAAILGTVLWRGFDALSWSFVSEGMRAAGAEGGIVYQIAGTAILVLTAVAAAVPLAAGAGVWLVMYAGNAAKRAFEATLHAVNGIPSIVFGLLGFAFFFELLGLKKSWLAGGLLLALMILPTLVVAFVEKLRSIPQSTIHAAFGLGLRRGDVVRTVLLPQGVSGLLTGTLLGIARAAGETAPILFTAAIFSGATIPTGIADNPVLALPYHIFVLAQDSFDPAMRSGMWGTAAVLVVLVTCASALAIPLRLKIGEEAARE